MRSRKFLAVLCVVCVVPGLLLSLASIATAHANYVRSVPEAGSVSPISPRVVQVWFSEPVDPAASSLSVLNATGKAVSNADSHIATDDARSLSVTVPPLAQGTYTVLWQTLSAVDGHTAKGSFPFTVGAGHPTSSYAALVDQMERNAVAVQPPPFTDTLLRWSTLTALVLVAGGFAFAPFALSAPELHSYRNTLAGRRRRLLWISLALLGITLIAGVAQRATEMNLSSALSGRFGLVVIARIVLGGLLAVMLWRQCDATLLVTLPGALLLLSQSMLSHSAAQEAWLFPTLVDWLHLSAAAIWLGGIVMLALIVAPPAVADPAHRMDLRHAIVRFSPLAITSTIVLSVTGLVQSINFVGSLNTLLVTAYGRIVLAKIGLLIALIGFGAFHRLFIAPRLHLQAGQPEARALRTARQFRASVIGEAIVGLLLLGAAGALTALPSGRDVAPDPAARVHIQTQSAGDLVLMLGTTPSIVGDNQFALRLADAQGNPVPGVEKVMLRFRNLSMDMGESESVLQPYGSQYYTAESSVIAMDGWWQIEVIVRRTGKADTDTTFRML
ncbi:MAG TPA: copper resistance protein CopC, partial [Anaerolineae bacterium]